MTRIRVIVALGFCLALVSSASAQEAKWKDLIQQAQTLSKQGKYSEAIPIAWR